MELLPTQNLSELTWSVHKKMLAMFEKALPTYKKENMFFVQQK
jgi:hypothetical protein